MNKKIWLLALPIILLSFNGIKSTQAKAKNISRNQANIIARQIQHRNSIPHYRHRKIIPHRSPQRFKHFNFYQRKYALKKYSMKHYRTVNGNYSTWNTSPDPTTTSDYHHYRIFHTYGSVRTKFHTYKFLPFYRTRTQFRLRSPQSIVVTPNGQYAYIGYNSSKDFRYKNEMYPNGSTTIARLNLWRNNGSHRRWPKNNTFKVGPTFKGGHGQAMAYNPTTNQLWLLNNTWGPANPDSVELINTRTLKPIRKVHFRFRHIGMGDVIAFDAKGKAYNSKIEREHRTKAPYNSLKIYKGKITPNLVRFTLIKQGIRKAPSEVTQAMTYDPKSKRLYFVGDDVCVSIPINKLGRATKHNLQHIWFGNHHRANNREFEGMSFTRTGRAYLLLSSNPQIMKSNSNF